MLESLAIIVVNYGSSALFNNLISVQDSAPEARIIVVDNFSSAAELDRMRLLSRDRGWTLVESAENVGFGGGVNLGASQAFRLGCKDLLLLNPDAYISRDSLVALSVQASRHPRALVAPIIRTSAGDRWFDGAAVRMEDGSMARWRYADGTPPPDLQAWLTAACLWVTGPAWRAVGGFDETYFLYWEDVDLSIRAARADCQLIVASDASAVHDEGGTQGRSANSRAKSESYYYFNIRNRLVFAALNFDAKTVLEWKRTDLRHAKSVLLRGGRRQFIRPIAPLRAAVRGVLDGRRLARTLRGTD